MSICLFTSVTQKNECMPFKENTLEECVSQIATTTLENSTQHYGKNPPGGFSITSGGSSDGIGLGGPPSRIPPPGGGLMLIPRGGGSGGIGIPPAASIFFQKAKSLRALLVLMENNRKDEKCSNLIELKESEKEKEFLECREGFLMTLNVLHTFSGSGEEEESHKPIHLPGSLYTRFEEMAKATEYQSFSIKRLQKKVAEFLKIYDKISEEKLPKSPDNVLALRELLEITQEGKEGDYVTQEKKILKIGVFLSKHRLLREVSYLTSKLNGIMKEISNLLLLKKIEDENDKMGDYPQQLMQSYKLLSKAVGEKRSFSEIQSELKEFWDLAYASIQMHKKFQDPIREIIIRLGGGGGDDS